MSQKVGTLQLKKKIQKPNAQQDKKHTVQQDTENYKQNLHIEQKIEGEKIENQFNPVELAQQIGGNGKTSAEVQFDLVRLKRLGEKIEKKMELTYRQKIERFNKKIQKMPEHYDIPKVGPG